MADETDELREAQADLARATARAEELAEQSAREASTDLVALGGTQDATAVRAQMQRVRRDAENAKREVERATARVSRELERQMAETKAELDRRLAKVNASLEPVKKRIELMQEGIETIGLYLSAAEGVEVIRDGERADELEPIVIRQLVLAMDEETMLYADDGGIDATRVSSFDKWLLADERHVERILPERKCVVAVVPRWRERPGQDPWDVDPADHVTHFLVRNGEALFRTTVNDFMAGEVLIPRGDEFVKYFRPTWAKYDPDTGHLLNPLQPGSREYAEAMDRSDRKGRHFLRIGLILQGLVDNSDVFTPLHPAGVNMLTDPSERSEKCRIITDAEGGLESGAESFDAWRQRLNEQLRPGMRIVGWFQGWDSEWAYANENDRESSRGHSRVSPDGAEHPPTGEPLVIEERDGSYLVCRYKRTATRWVKEWVETRPGWGYNGHVERGYKTRASVRLLPTDDFILPYDLIESSDELRRFLESRRERRNYRELWPLIRATLKAKREEEEAEAPFLVMLSGVLARENGVEVADAEREVAELVRWWKLKNRHHRALTKDEAGAVRMIVAEHARRMKDRRRPVSTTVVAKLRELHPDAVAVVRPRSGGYTVLVPAFSDQNTYVHEHDYTAKAEPREVREWRMVGTDRPTRWTVAWSSERWAEWNLAARPQDYATGPERAELVELCRGLLRGAEQLWAVSYVAPTATQPERVCAWVYRPDHQYSYEARVRAWRRTDGGLRLVRASRSYWADDDHVWSEGASFPWEGSYASEYVERWLMEPDEQISAAFTERRAKARARREREDEQRRVAGNLSGSIGAQWEALRLRAVYDRWCAEHEAEGDDGWTWEEWEKHVKVVGDGHDKGGWGPYALDWGAYPCDEGHVTRALVEFLVKHGKADTMLNEAWTVSRALEEALTLGMADKMSVGYNTGRHEVLASETLTQQTRAFVFGGEPVAPPEPPERLGGTVCVECGERKADEEFQDGAVCIPCAEDRDEEENVELRLDDDVVILGPEEDDPEDGDEFDALRDALR